MKLTLIYASVGRRIGQKYLKGWQMEPLPLAAIAGLTPSDVDVSFYDDRMDVIPFDKHTDLVAISVETYTAKRAYQIASEYRRNGVPVVMGGFHATLCPEEVSQYAEAVVIGEAENLWERVLIDAERGSLQPYYLSNERPSLEGIIPNRSIYSGRNYLPITLVETARGCQFQCDFCSIQAFSNHEQNVRPVGEIVAEVESVKRKPLIFFVDDNFTLNRDHAKALLRDLVPLNIRWVSQIGIDAAHDEELLRLMAKSGCLGILIGLESLNQYNLEKMNKGFNLMKGGFERALENLRRNKIRLYTTFIFGYDEDTVDSFEKTVEFAKKHNFFVSAFNHLVPFPGTPLYERLEEEGRLLYDKWWLDDNYGFYMIPFQPLKMTPEQLERGCIEARRAYYKWDSILKRGMDPVNRKSPLIWFAYYWINYIFRQEVNLREHFPLGDETWNGKLIKVRESAHPLALSTQLV